MKRRTLWIAAGATVAAGLSFAAPAQAEKVKIGISIPAATHGWTGGLNY